MDLILRHTSPLYPPHPRAKPIRYQTFDLAFGPSRPRQSTRSVCRSVADRTVREGESGGIGRPSFYTHLTLFLFTRLDGISPPPPPFVLPPPRRPRARPPRSAAVCNIGYNRTLRTPGGGRRAGRRDLSTPAQGCRLRCSEGEACKATLKRIKPSVRRIRSARVSENFEVRYRRREGEWMNGVPERE